ncbi:helix-turn-helix domain-containing protein [Nonomuraea sp. SYSU D8015]|uniref:helix-turn-helix domain-containing protein n=1 Tax=Nonomuraea sp. SYSU D8015 TaxID=2593644 RepID=UPI001660CEAD|nr:AraC family transcriptional regulator [Nonomuraea sp. SYSU D8015]
MIAAALLHDSDLPLRSVAEPTGYASEFAFARAFKREFGTAPGRYGNGQDGLRERAGAEGALTHGLPYYTMGAGKPLVALRWFAPEHANPTGWVLRSGLKALGPLGRHFEVYAVNRAPGPGGAPQELLPAVKGVTVTQNVPSLTDDEAWRSASTTTGHGNRSSWTRKPSGIWAPTRRGGRTGRTSGPMAMTRPSRPAR